MKSAYPGKTLVPRGDDWLLLLFWPNLRLTVTLVPVHSDKDTWNLCASHLDFDNPPESLEAFLAEIGFDDLIAEADLQAHHLISQPDWDALRTGTRTPPDLLRRVVEMRRTKSAIQIAKELGKTRSTIHRYLRLAADQGITGKGEEHGNRR